MSRSNPAAAGGDGGAEAAGTAGPGVVGIGWLVVGAIGEVGSAGDGIVDGAVEGNEERAAGGAAGCGPHPGRPHARIATTARARVRAVVAADAGRLKLSR